jgi:hypothetical protein
VTFPSPELHMRDPEHFEWVKAKRDPELWHAATKVIVNTLGDPHGFLVCLCSQPKIDRPTAGWVFTASQAKT